VSLGEGDPLPELLAAMAVAARRLADLEGGAALAAPLAAAGADLGAASRWIVEQRGEAPDDVLAVATPYLDVLARAVAGTLLAEEVLTPTAPHREAAARYFLTQLRAQRPDLGAAMAGGAAALDWLVPAPLANR
jgi:hypothetical protein